MKATSLRALVLLLLVCVCAAAVQAQTARRGTSAAGRRLFHSAAASANGLSCAHCHADFDEDRRGDGLIRAGEWHHVVVGWKISGTGKIAGSLALDEVVLASRPYLRNWPKGGLDLARCRVYVGSRGGRSIQAVVDEFRIGK